MIVPNHGDIIDLLLAQHEEVKQAFDEVFKTKGKAKAMAFVRLQALLQMHEEGEQQVVHPVTLDRAGSPDVALHVLQEEQNASMTLSRLNRMGVGDPQFDTELSMLHAMVLEHASEEESDEFPRLRATQT